MPDIEEGCRVHPGLPVARHDLCSTCCHRLDKLMRRYHHLASFTAEQRETLLGLGRPDAGMCRHWPQLKRWIAKARRDRARGEAVADTARRWPPCCNAVHKGQKVIPRAGSHGLCVVCKDRLGAYRYGRGSFRPGSLSLQALLGTPLDSLHSIAEGWANGDLILEARRRAQGGSDGLS